MCTLTDDVGGCSESVFPWHSLLPFLHITPERGTPSGMEFNDHTGTVISLTLNVVCLI